MALFTRVKYLCTFNIVALLIYHLLLIFWKALYTISASIFDDVPYWLACSMGRFISCVLPGPWQRFGEEIIIAWSHIRWVRWMFQNLPLPVEWRFALSWTMMGFCTTKCRRFLLSPCDYDVFAKKKEPLRRTRYNIRRELIRAIIIIRVFCPKAGPSLQEEKPRLQFCRRQVFHCKLRSKPAVLLGINRCSFPLLSAFHSLFSTWTDRERSEKIPGAPTWRWGPSGLHRNSPEGLNISTISVLDQIRDPEIPITLRLPLPCTVVWRFW